MSSCTDRAASAAQENGAVLLVGAGNLAWSLACGVLSSGLLTPDRIRVTNRSDQGRLERFAVELGATAGRDMPALLAGASTVILAVKPDDAAVAIRGFAGHLDPGTLLISAVAGLPLAYLEAEIPAGCALIRAMPNTSLQVGMSATALAAGPGAGPDAIARARLLFGAVGLVVEVSEAELDAVTAVSGSGPAYFYYFCELLIAAGQQAGLSRDLASSLAVQTIRGAAAMLEVPGADPAVLRRQVTSARGTTEAGLSAMAAGRLPDAVIQAVLSAKRRAVELSRAFGSPSARPN